MTDHDVARFVQIAKDRPKVGGSDCSSNRLFPDIPCCTVATAVVSCRQLFSSKRHALRESCLFLDISYNMMSAASMLSSLRNVLAP